MIALRAGKDGQPLEESRVSSLKTVYLREVIVGIERNKSLFLKRFSFFMTPKYNISRISFSSGCFPRLHTILRLWKLLLIVSTSLLHFILDNITVASTVCKVSISFRD